MKKMPELVQLGKKYGEQGLVIVGINFDRTEAKAREAIAAQGITWPQVYAKAAAKDDAALWREASSIEGLPRFLVIGRDGVLRLDVYPTRLAELVEPLLREEAAKK